MGTETTSKLQLKDYLKMNHVGAYPFIEVTTKIGCQNNCKYCPQKQFINSYKGKENELSYKNFVKLINKVPKNIDLVFCGFSEPFQNKNCHRMINYADKQGHTIKIYTTLVGLNIEKLNSIKHIKFSEFAIHLPCNEKLEKITVDKKYMELLKKVIEYQITGLRFVHNGTLPQKIAKLVKGNTVYQMDVISRAGNLGKKTKKTGKLFCSQNWNQLFQTNLLPNGDVYVCCMDYGLKHQFGNLFNQEYSSLFDSKEFDKVKECLDFGEGETICNYCERGIKVNSLEYFVFWAEYCKNYMKICLKFLIKKNKNEK